MTGTRDDIQPLRIVLVESPRLVREALRALLQAQPGFVVVGEAGTCRDALRVSAREQPDLVLLGLELGAEQGVEAIAELSGALKLRVLVLTAADDADLHRRAIHLGAQGVLLKDQDGATLTKAIRCVCAGEVWLNRGLTAAVLKELRRGDGNGAGKDPEAERAERLTLREREIVRLVAQGFGTQKLADTLFVAEKTVRNHLASIYDKLQITGRLDLALYAVKHGLVGPSVQPALRRPPVSR